ncbi:MAG: sigma-54-dependent Fis family transcriptional regulator [Xanthomonadales bacterium]|nr:sigma-54-dependent Fis family transcriptional regulator [Xanthomonadales bacterium]
MDKIDYQEWLFRNTPVLATTIDEDGRYLDVSDAFAARLGYKLDTLRGLRPDDLATPECARRIRDEYRPILRRTGQIQNVPVEFLTRGGATVHLVTSSISETDDEGGASFSFAVYSEIGEVARIEERFRNLYRSSPTMLHSMDPDGCIVEVSSRWLRRMGYERSEVLGKSMFDFYSPATNREIQSGDLKRLVELGEYSNAPREMVTKDGRTIEVIASAAVERDDSGNPLRIYVASKDMTRHNKAQRELKEAFEENARLRRQLELERDYLRETIDVEMNFGRMVGSSPGLQRVLAGVQAVAASDASVLITGESGTGKELVAHAIHAASSRADRPLVKVNCASVPRDLFESEFFGHVRGAFTGAHRDRVGRFQLADGGTIFLDEVAEIPLELQAKLLRVLQERQFERVGEDRTRSVDVRVVAATNKDLEEEVAGGRFREDLYYRLSVFPLTVPPLRDRSDDVIQLTTHFIRQICQDAGRPLLRLTQADADRLRAYHWPGNIRELRNVLERAVILARGDRLVIDLPDENRAEAEPAPAGKAPPSFLTEAQFRQKEKENLVAALEHAGWRVSGPNGAASLLGLKPSTLNSRMKAFGVVGGDRRRGRPHS